MNSRHTPSIILFACVSGETQGLSQVEMLRHGKEESMTESHIFD